MKTRRLKESIQKPSHGFRRIHRQRADVVANVVLLDPEQLENHPIAGFIIFDKINLEHEFRRISTTRHEGRRTIAR